MNRDLILASVFVTLLIVGGQAIGGGGGHVRAQAEGAASTAPAAVKAGAEASASVQATADVGELKQKLSEKAARVSARARSRADARLAAEAHQCDETASKQGGPAIEGRLAEEFGLTAQALAEERTSYGASWGDLMIAHTLALNLKSGESAAQLLTLQRDGMGWGQIAAGLGLRLGSCLGSVTAENRVASGLSRADGRVAAIQGEDARVGLNTGPRLHGGVGAGAAGVNARTGAGVGVKVGK
jgi:hypothetical protein